MYGFLILTTSVTQSNRRQRYVREPVYFLFFLKPECFPNAHPRPSFIPLHIFHRLFSTYFPLLSSLFIRLSHCWRYKKKHTAHKQLIDPFLHPKREQETSHPLCEYCAHKKKDTCVLQGGYSLTYMSGRESGNVDTHVSLTTGVKIIQVYVVIFL